MIEFKNPPARKKTVRRVSAETQAILDALQARPREWALIRKDASPTTTTWWKKRPGLEAKSSTIGKPKGKVDVYVRWVGVK